MKLEGADHAGLYRRHADLAIALHGMAILVISLVAGLLQAAPNL